MKRTKNTLKTLVLGFVLIAFVFGCMDLDVVNPNNPDTERALAEAEDVQALMGGSFLTFWSMAKNYPHMTLSVMSGRMTSSWGNFGMFLYGAYPRVEFQNDQSSDFIGMVNAVWFNMYSVISSVNDGLRLMDAGLVLPQEARARAWAKFMQGLAHGYIALHHDQGFIFDETIDLTERTLEWEDMRPYNEVMEAAIGFLEASITISNANSFTTPSSWINGRELTNEQLAQLAHSLIARFKAQVARTPAEREAVDWASVVSHAEAGITETASVQGDGVFWWNRHHSLAQDAGWMRVNYYTVGPADNAGVYEGSRFQNWRQTSYVDRREFIMENVIDQRIGTEERIITEGPDLEGVTEDYVLTESSPFSPARGLYFYSRYQHIRHFPFYAAGYVGPMMFIMKAEMDLLIAEGEIRLERDLDKAATMINNTRVDRGGLEGVTAGDGAAVLLEAMKYEHRIETLNSFTGVDFYTDRGWGELIDRTPLHFPVPAQEIETLLADVYSFGGGGEGSADFGFAKRRAETLLEAGKNPIKK